MKYSKENRDKALANIAAAGFELSGITKYNWKSRGIPNEYFGTPEEIREFVKYQFGKRSKPVPTFEPLPEFGPYSEEKVVNAALKIVGFVVFLEKIEKKTLPKYTLAGTSDAKAYHKKKYAVKTGKLTPAELQTLSVMVREFYPSVTPSPTEIIGKLSFKDASVLLFGKHERKASQKIYKRKSGVKISEEEAEILKKRYLQLREYALLLSAKLREFAANKV